MSLPFLIVFFVGLLPLFLMGLKQKFFRLPVMYIIAISFFVISSSIYYFTSAVRINLFNLENYMDDAAYWKTIEYFLSAMIAFMVGSLISRFIRVHPQKIQRKIIEPKNPEKSPVNWKKIFASLPFWPMYILFIITFGLFIALYITSSWSLAGMWVRSRYMVDGSNFVKNVLLFLNVLYFAYAGLYLYANRKNPLLLIAYIFPVILFLLQLSTGSRQFIIDLAIFLFVPTFLLKFRRVDWLFRTLILLAGVFYVIPLRNLPVHGLLPYTGVGWILGLTPSPIEQILRDSYFVYYYNAILGFYLTSFVLNAGVANLETFAVSINPLTSNFIGWYDLAPLLRVNIYAPFNLYGEVFALGLSYVWLFFVALGVVITLIDRWVFIKRLEKNKFGFVPMFMFIMFIIFSYEYNLRTGMRLLYYTIAFIFAYSVFQYFENKVRRRRLV